MAKRNLPQARVLIMVDDALYRAVIRTVLTRAGFHAVGGESFLHAWGLFERERFDLVVCDLESSDAKRLMLLESPRAKACSGRMVLLAENGQDGRDEVVFAPRWPEVLAKPVSHTELLEALSRVLLREARAPRGRDEHAGRRRTPCPRPRGPGRNTAGGRQGGAGR